MINGTSALNFNEGNSNIVQFPGNQPTKKKTVCNYKIGEKQEVYPFRTEDDLQKMLHYFVEKKQDRNICMFIVGINVGLRASDLLSLKWNQVFSEADGEFVDYIEVQERKTKKFRKFYLNNSVKRAFTEYRKTLRSYDSNAYVFASRKGNESVDVRSAGKILKTAAKAVGIKYNVGTHSMRKTFGYWQLKAHSNDAMFLCNLQEMFNHSSPAITLRYCGLRDEEMEKYYNDVCLL